MTTPINLNKARKARAKTQKAQQASENRVKFGRSKSQKQMDAKQQTATVHGLDGKRLDGN